MILRDFDPFRDRLSRDICNQLSASLLVCLHASDFTPARLVADRFLATPPARVYIKREYGFAEAAGRMAIRVLPVLAACTDPERLLAALRSVYGRPPLLFA